MKYFGVLTLALLVVFITSSCAQSNNITFGHIGPNDFRVHHQYVIKKSRPLLIVSEDVQYPPKGVIGQRVITGIRCTDQYINGKGGYVSMKEGGPGFFNVTLHFKSQRGHGYNFILEIYVR